MFSPVFSLTDISHPTLISSHGLVLTTLTPSSVKKQYITLKKLRWYSEFTWFHDYLGVSFQELLYNKKNKIIDSPEILPVDHCRRQDIHDKIHPQ